MDPMIILPRGKDLPINNLTAVFRDTTNSYKFYWFLAILDEISESRNAEIPIANLNKKMIESVLYPLNYFKLSFGKSDSFKKISDYLKVYIDLDFTITSDSIWEQIDKNLNTIQETELANMVKTLNRWVPYRFLRPFFAIETRGLNDTQVNNEIKKLAANRALVGSTSCPYHFYKDRIIINNFWFNYFNDNMGILQGFAYWHLIKFLQKNNPNVPGISEKIFKLRKRNLTKYTETWKTIIKQNTDISCIFSGQPLNENFSLDHFIPWSYVTHDLNWNLVPTTKSINSSKSDNLPNLKKYLKPFTDLQFHFYHMLYTHKINVSILEEYSLLFTSNVDEIFHLSEHRFKRKIIETITPMEQIAANMGFKQGWNYY